MDETATKDDKSDYDTNKYVSREEYLRDVVALKNKRAKIVVYFAAGMAIGLLNIWLIRFMELDSQFDWIVYQPGSSGFAMDQIMAWLAVIFVLLIPGIWIGVAKHKLYALVYFSGFCAAGIVFMGIPGFLIKGLYVFTVSFFLLILMYLIFFKIWTSMKRSIVKAQD
nr:hypothetical protein [Candidatus Sigynarchaeota archaeon]